MPEGECVDRPVICHGERRVVLRVRAVVDRGRRGRRKGVGLTIASDVTWVFPGEKFLFSLRTKVRDDVEVALSSRSPSVSRHE
jgi:hypothetical protein